MPSNFLSNANNLLVQHEQKCCWLQTISRPSGFQPETYRCIATVAVSAIFSLYSTAAASLDIVPDYINYIRADNNSVYG